MLERNLPDLIKGTDCISFREIHQNIKVFVNDELREAYDFSNEKLKWKSPISRNMYIELSPDDSGARLRIEGISPTDGSRVLSKVYYGEKAGILSDYVYSEAVGIVFGILFLAIGVVGIISGQIIRFATRGRVKVDTVGWAMLVVAIWNIAQSDYREYFFVNINKILII